mmetsp:Transcript_69264/g.130602  ORF Transcript_69264/g.130602 Transcript_69264/m.130602 type:complete len:104 (+) Transcript_69264:303-614(+)
MLNVYRQNYSGGCRIPQYRSAIWYHSPQQQVLAEAMKKELSSSGFGQLDVEPVKPWWNAEFYHQKYQQRAFMTLGLWMIMGSFCTVGGVLFYPLKVAFGSSKS